MDSRQIYLQKDNIKAEKIDVRIEKAKDRWMDRKRKIRQIDEIEIDSEIKSDISQYVCNYRQV